MISRSRSEQAVFQSRSRDQLKLRGAPLKKALLTPSFIHRSSSPIILHAPSGSRRPPYPLVLVTGASGYIGSHLVLELLRQANYGVIALDNLSNSSLDALRRVLDIVQADDQEPKEIPPLYFHHADIRHRTTLEAVFARYEGQIVHVIHFAALKSVSRSAEAPQEYFHTNVQGTANLLAAMAHAGVRSLVFSSSAVVYGDRVGAADEALNVLLSEEDCWVRYPFEPELRKRNYTRIRNVYGKTKLRAEELIHQACATHPGLRGTILRYTNPSGNDPSGRIGDCPREPENLMAIAAQVLQGRKAKISIFGTDYRTRDGTGIRDFIHVQDLVKGHLAALDLIERDGDSVYPENCKTYNLGTGRGATVKEVMNALGTVTGRRVPTEDGPRRTGDLAVVVCDPRKAEAELGWTAQLDVCTMARDLWTFCQRQQTDSP